MCGGDGGGGGGADMGANMADFGFGGGLGMGGGYGMGQGGGGTPGAPPASGQAELAFQGDINPSNVGQPQANYGSGPVSGEAELSNEAPIAGMPTAETFTGPPTFGESSTLAEFFGLNQQEAQELSDTLGKQAMSLAMPLSGIPGTLANKGFAEMINAARASGQESGEVGDIGLGGIGPGAEEIGQIEGEQNPVIANMPRPAPTAPNYTVENARENLPFKGAGYLGPEQLMTLISMVMPQKTSNWTPSTIAAKRGIRGKGREVM